MITEERQRLENEKLAETYSEQIDRGLTKTQAIRLCAQVFDIDKRTVRRRIKKAGIPPRPYAHRERRRQATYDAIPFPRPIPDGSPESQIAGLEAVVQSFGLNSWRREADKILSGMSREQIQRVAYLENWHYKRAKHTYKVKRSVMNLLTKALLPEPKQEPKAEPEEEEFVSADRLLQPPVSKEPDG